jgi:uncharacterized membrane protein YjgN (DUF898 family)
MKSAFEYDFTAYMVIGYLAVYQVSKLFYIVDALHTRLWFCCSIKVGCVSVLLVNKTLRYKDFNQ